MKAGALILALVFAFAVYVMLHPPRGGSIPLPGLSLVSQLAKHADPAEEMKAMADQFPRHGHHKTTTDDFLEIGYDVPKNEPGVNPPVGYLYFTDAWTVHDELGTDSGTVKYRMVFQWQDERWKFHMLENLDKGTDVTGAIQGETLRQTEPLQPFFAAEGWRSSGGATTAPASGAVAASGPTGTPGKSQSDALREQFAAQEARAREEAAAAAAARTPSPEEIATQQAARARAQASDIARKYSGH